MIALIQSRSTPYIAAISVVDKAPTASLDKPVAQQKPETKKITLQKSAAIAPQVAPKTPPRAVFGASRNTIADENGVDLKQGNTVLKEEDALTLKKDDVDNANEGVPEPADEFLVTRMPQLKSEIRIPYPEEAKKQGIQGSVVLDLLIDTKGRVRDARLIEGPGFGLNEAALSAVKDLLFTPAFVGENPVAVRIRYAYRFVLEQ